MRQSQVAMLCAVGTIVMSIVAAAIIVRVALPRSDAAPRAGDRTGQAFDLRGSDDVMIAAMTWEEGVACSRRIQQVRSLVR